MSIDWINNSGMVFGRSADVWAQLWRVVIDRGEARGTYGFPPGFPLDVVSLTNPANYHGEVLATAIPAQIELLTSAINFLCKTEPAVFGSVAPLNSWEYSSYVDSNTEEYTGPGSPDDGGVDNGGKDKLRRADWGWYVDRFRDCLDALDNQRALAIGQAWPIPSGSAVFDSLDCVKVEGGGISSVTVPNPPCTTASQYRRRTLGFYNEFGNPDNNIDLPWAFASPSGGTLLTQNNPFVNQTDAGLFAVNNFGSNWWRTPNPAYRAQNTRTVVYYIKRWADDAVLLTERYRGEVSANIIEEDDPFQDMSGDTGEGRITVQIWDGDEGDLDPDKDEGVIDFGSSVFVTSATPFTQNFPFTTRENTDELGDGTAGDGVFIAFKLEVTKGPQVDSYMDSVRGYAFSPQVGPAVYQVAYRKPIAEWSLPS